MRRPRTLIGMLIRWKVWKNWPQNLRNVIISRYTFIAKKKQDDDTSRLKMMFRFSKTAFVYDLDIQKPTVESDIWM